MRVFSPIFVVGYMHSGTTLLMDILSRHSDVYSGQGESKLYELLPLIAQRYPDLTNDQTAQMFVSFVARVIQSGFSLAEFRAPFQPKPNSLSVDEISKILGLVGHGRTHGHIISVVFNYLAHKNSKTRWLEKTPTHIFFY